MQLTVNPSIELSLFGRDRPPQRKRRRGLESPFSTVSSPDWIPKESQGISICIKYKGLLVPL